MDHPVMRMRRGGAAALCCVIGLLSVSAVVDSGENAHAMPIVHHELEVTVDPEARGITVIDRFILPAADEAADREHGTRVVSEPLPPGFFLNAELDVHAVRVGDVPVGVVDPDPGVTYPHGGGDGDRRGADDLDLDQQSWRFVRLQLDQPAGKAIEVVYGGFLFDALEAPPQEYSRSFETTSGLIDTLGVYLSGATGWIPTLPAVRLTFEMAVRLPEGWRSMSQGVPGASEDAEVWICEEPQEEIYLVAGRYHVTEREHDGVLMQTFTYADDAELSERYLEATANYLDMYGELIGAYPYDKFALVENFWQSGYGMPSFTLLGDQIIRMPWIISTSYGHEILHNWFGNGVYVAWERGNWCEGLTSYLADHLYKEQQGQGPSYRRATLRAYRDFVRESNDFALTDFRSRHDPVTQAVGYGKTMMVFHMLRQELGDATFVAGLRRFVADRVFLASDWDDVEAAFEAESGEDLGWFFEQWVERPGAPEIELGKVSSVANDGRHRLSVELSLDADAPYRLTVPVAVTLAGASEPIIEQVEVDGSTAMLEDTYDLPPLFVAVDPAFDVFRRIDRREIPPALGELFGAEEVMIVVPGGAAPELQAAYGALAETWAAGSGIDIVTDVELEQAPARQSVWVLGAENAFLSRVAGDVWTDADSIALGGRRFGKSGHSFVYAVHPDGDTERTWGFITTDDPAAVPGLARKLPHYKKYSYLVFQGEEPTNVHKGEWAASGSPLVRAVASPSEVAARQPLAVPAAAPLIERKLSFDAAKLEAHVGALSAPEMEGRGLGTEGIELAARYIAEQLRLSGLLPGGDDGYLQTWRARTGPNDEEIELRNVLGILPGTEDAYRDECVVVAAHYDHLGRGWPDAHAGDQGKLHPGADDNASGVAIALELARIMAGSTPPKRNVVFAFFTGEEAENLGSRYYVEHPIYPLARTIGVINLDTVGRLFDGKLRVFGAESTREMPHVIRGCGYVTGVPTEMASAAMGASDQLTFHERGIPAVQLFSGPHTDYHRPGDTADKVDVAGMAKVAAFTREAVHYLAGSEGPMTWVLESPPPATGVAGGTSAGMAGAGDSAGGGSAAATPATGGSRRVSLGTIPDFGYEDGGVRLDGTVPGSPAAAAGLQKGDIIVKLGEYEVRALRDLSDALKAHEPGDQVMVVFRRAGAEETREVTLKAR